MMPLVAGAGRARWALPLAALAMAAGLALAAAKAPAFSAERPEHMNVTFLQLDGESEARWVVSPQSRSLPASVRQAASFGASAVPAFPWSTSATAFAAAAPRIDAPSPEMQVLERGQGEAERRVRLLVTSPRGARIVMLLLPRERVASVAIGGRTIPGRAPQDEARRGEQTRVGFRSYACLTVPPQGVEVDVVLAGAGPLDGYLVDYSFGLPAGGDALVRARPTEATAIRFGDVTILGRRVSL
jgi:hypothetical protein